MYARVASWEGASGDALRSAAGAINDQNTDGPPEGLPAVGFLLLIDPDNGRSRAVTLFETEDDMRQGDAKLNTMSPPGEGMGTRSAVEFYEVAADMRL